MQLDPPMVLKRTNIPESSVSKHFDEESMLFETQIDSSQTTGPDDEQRGGCQKVIFYDVDYTEDNKTYNRVKSYSFARV